MKLKTNNTTKGIIFAGCSFTWGQGLYYYSNLPTVSEPKNYVYTEESIKDSHHMIRKTLYYPRLVANHFNTFEITKIQNGGSDFISLEFINDVFNLNKYPSPHINEKYTFDEIEYIIFQTSQVQRNPFIYNFEDENGINREHKFRLDLKESHNHFFKYLNKINKNFDDWYKEFVQDNFQKIKNKLQLYENLGIKTLILCWPDDYLELIKNDDFLSKRLITFEYDGVEYHSISKMIDFNKHLQIMYDMQYFTIPPQDLHPSKECHKIIANCIIKKINNMTYDIKKPII